MPKATPPDVAGYPDGRPDGCGIPECTGRPTTVHRIVALARIDGEHQMAPAILALCGNHDIGSEKVPAHLVDAHVMEWRTEGDREPWTLLHPIRCRPDLFKCVVNRAAEQTREPLDPGRYVVDTGDDDQLVVIRQLEEGELLGC